MNYGFINLNNDANEYPFKVYYEPEDKLLLLKKEMIGDESEFKKFRVVANFEERIMHEFMSWLRFVLYDENITLLLQYKGAAVSAAENKKRH